MSVFNLGYGTVIWVLENLDILLGGEWPDASGNPEIDNIIKRGKRSLPHAYFEDPILLAVEVQERMFRCGWDGLLVEQRYIKGISEDDIAEKRHLWIRRVRNGIHRALVYMSGVNRKKLTYQEWKSENRNKREVRNGALGAGKFDN